MINYNSIISINIRNNIIINTFNGNRLIDEIIYGASFLPNIRGLILYLSLKQINPKFSIKQTQLNEPFFFEHL